MYSCLLLTPFPAFPPRCKSEKEEDLGNAQAVRRHARQIPVYELPRLPPSDKPLYAWYAASTKDFKILLEGLAERRRKEVKDALGMKERGKKAIWWPFTQHDEVADAEITVLDSAYGDYFCCTEVEGGGGANVSQGLRASERFVFIPCRHWGLRSIDDTRGTMVVGS